ncbi:MAG: hypothetical protein KDE04_24425, partial [Anaerolineales bacterium]|nr:hypothetical protein [Anaerolineales bacterium]
NPMYIASAKLLVAPSGYWASNHRTCYDILANCSSLSAWTESFLFSTGFNKDIELQYLGSCPGNGCIVDLADTNFTMSFAASPENGNVIGGVRTLEVPPSSTDGEIQEPPDVQPNVYRPLNGDPVFWEWDVTSAIQGWYQELYDHGSTGAPTFMLRLDPTQLCPPGPYENEAETAAITCAALKIVAENIQLVIDYEPLLLNAAIDPVTSKNHLTNTMGVPSYNPGVFDSAQIVDQDLQTTGHLYRLQDNDSGQTQWRAIAVRGDHLVDPAPNSGVGLALWQYPTFAGDDPTRLQVALGDPADTQLLFIDEWQAVANSADLRAEVTAATEETPVNREARDTAANYRIQHQFAESWNVPVGASTDQSVGISTEELVVLRQFELDSMDNLLISVTTLPTVPVKIMLIPPTAQSGAFVATQGTILTGTNGVYSFNGSMPVSGRYLLAIINEGRPAYYPPPEPQPKSYDFAINLVRCNRFGIPVQRFRFITGVACQPVPLPSNG